VFDVWCQAAYSPRKKPVKREPAKDEKYRSFFPKDYSSEQIENVIVGLLADWKAKATA